MLHFGDLVGGDEKAGLAVEVTETGHHGIGRFQGLAEYAGMEDGGKEALAHIALQFLEVLIGVVEDFDLTTESQCGPGRKFPGGPCAYNDNFGGRNARYAAQQYAFSAVRLAEIF